MTCLTHALARSGEHICLCRGQVTYMDGNGCDESKTVDKGDGEHEGRYGDNNRVCKTC